MGQVVLGQIVPRQVVLRQVLSGSASTTEAVRRAIQLRQESVRAAAKRCGLSPTPVQKQRSHQTKADDTRPLAQTSCGDNETIWP